MKISEAEKKAVVVDTDSIPVGAANSPKAYRFTMQQVKQYANDGMATKSEMDATIVRAESLSRQAALAAQQVQRDTEELKQAMQNLPDGQAVSAQVANLQVKKADKEQLNEKMPLGGRDPRAWVGMADQLAPSEKTEQAAYRDEVLPAGRILGFAPELGPSGAGTRDGQIADSVSPVMREVSGVSSGANQYCGVRTFPASTIPSIEIAKNVKVLIVTNFTDLSTNRSRIKFAWLVDGAERNQYSYYYTNVQRPQILSHVTSFTDNYSGVRAFFTDGDKSQEAKFNNFAVLNLTLLPQLPAPFVASLRESDAHRVAHALGFLALQRD